MRMRNPWEEIDLSDYEGHMRRDDVFQLQALNHLTAEQLFAYEVKSVMILGVAGGNGLEHIHPNNFKRIYGVDINRDYLSACVERYPELSEIFEPIRADIRDDATFLPRVDLVIANILVEYIGCDCFRKAIARISPRFVSCGIIRNGTLDVVSDSPYIRAFNRLGEVYCRTEECELTRALAGLGYSGILREETALPNGKTLVRIDFHAPGGHSEKIF